MDSRREFFKKAALLAAGGGLAGAVPASIQKAFAIDPRPGSTWLDAEHVVILMQENRSFDHAYGTLRGVRGFNDPRATTLPGGNPVWLQSNAAGQTYAPFHFDIKDTKITWMGFLPHVRESQTGARNGGRHDGWLDAKASCNELYSHLPLTMGHYDRNDLPFYYALADAFTVCDQNFCSALTCTTPNRLYLWSGTIRAEPSIFSPVHLNNEDADHGHEIGWTTFPERLEALGIPWRVYQNELDIPTGLNPEETLWLGNFGCNPLEYFTQYGVRYAAGYRSYLRQAKEILAARIRQLESEWPRTPAMDEELRAKRVELDQVEREAAIWTAEAFAQLPESQQDLHRRAFTINDDDPDYRRLVETTYRDGNDEHTMKVPKGDLFHRFREDVRADRLPTVSWLVPPESFSDHPESAWYGAWYLSEALDILTQNPEIWKKTIFILCYDENDGYFDHVPPYMAPHPYRPGTGKVSAGIDTSVEHPSPRQEKPRPDGGSDSIGLGFRVPLVVASPWSRGGYVCSELFDQTSILRFLETFLSHKTGQPVRETNLSTWRRTVCGDLTSVFRPYYGDEIVVPTPVDRASFIDSIARSQFRPLPDGFKSLTPEEIARIRENPRGNSCLPRQEAGLRPACALPYELGADGALSADRKTFRIELKAGNEIMGHRAAGAPFRVYTPDNVRQPNGALGMGRVWDYAVAAGDRLADTWALDDFFDGAYRLEVSGPNGFHREFRGSAEDPLLAVSLQPCRHSVFPKAVLRLANNGSDTPLSIAIEDLSYGSGARVVELAPRGAAEMVLKCGSSYGWYDFRIHVRGAREFAQRYAGHLDTGWESFSDPAMGGAQTAARGEALAAPKETREKDMVF